MTQYDAGPGDWTDREWETPDRKPQPHARKRGIVLPPWALIVGVVAIAILLCVFAIILVRAIGGGGEETATPPPSATSGMAATATMELGLPTAEEGITPTATVVLPIGITDEVPAFTEIGIGAMVVVKGTGGAGLNLRAEPSQTSRIVVTAKEGTQLLVLEGPAGTTELLWWRVRAPDGKEGWAAAAYLVLKTQP